MTLVDILFKKFGVLLDHDFFLDLPLEEGLGDDLVVRLVDIDFDDRVVDEGWLVVAEGDEDGLLVDYVGSESEGELVGSVQHVLVEEAKVGVVSNGGIDERAAI